MMRSAACRYRLEENQKNQDEAYRRNRRVESRIKFAVADVVLVSRGEIDLVMVKAGVELADEVPVS